MKRVFENRSAFINRINELSTLKKYVEYEAKTLLFIYGPKSSGKTTLLFKFIDELKADKNHKYEVLHHNLREITFLNYRDFIKNFFVLDPNLQHKKEIESVKKLKVGFSLGAFTISSETIDKLEKNKFDPFQVMKKGLQELNQQGITPVIIIDELQALDDIYIDEQRLLIKELFNFFVAMTKESHLCHVIIASSDGYFIERIYNDSKLRKTSEFMAVDYLTEKDTLYWLHNLEKESAIKAYTLTEKQIIAIWNFFGGSCWEVSNFLDIIRDGAENGSVPQEFFDKKLEYKKIQMRSYFEDYLRYERQQNLFTAMNHLVQKNKIFKTSEVHSLVEPVYSFLELKEELTILVQKNFLQYNPVTAEYALQGSSMEIGLEMYVEMITKK